MSDDDKKDSFKKLHQDINALLTEIAVNEEKMKNHLSKEEFSEKTRELEQKIYQLIVKNKEISTQALSDYKIKIIEDMSDMKVEIAKSAMIRSLIVSVIGGIIICAITYFMK